MFESHSHDPCFEGMKDAGLRGVMESCTVVPDCLEARQCVAGFEFLEYLRGHCVKL